MSGVTFRGKFPPVKPDPTVDDCLRALRFSDYAQWIGVSVGGWGYGLVIGKPARFHMAGLCGALGFTFGSMVVIQNTRGRLMGFRENTREIKMYGEFETAGPAVLTKPMDRRFPEAVKPISKGELNWSKFN
jgi:hypothetical protein